ncbi:MAG: hypothetical protein HY536_00005, partial [Candidatus Colwellbacteria bacterium]|nr:hypothetical protein [Candidatus Colwellbacteria bacterium]
MKLHSEIHFEEAAFDASRGEEPEFRETPASGFAFLLVLTLALTLAAVATGRIVSLAAVSGEFYRARSLANLTRELAVPTYRAVITDRFGEPLVQNESSFTVLVHVPTLIANERGAAAVIDELAASLGVSPNEIAAQLAAADLEQVSWVTIARSISAGQAIG